MKKTYTNDMQNNLDEEDEPQQPEVITHPAIVRLRDQLEKLTMELIEETLFEPDRQQIEQAIHSLSLLRTNLLFVDDLATLDAMLRMTFPAYYYAPIDGYSVRPINLPLSGNN